jgi:phosphate transport system protein
MNVHVAKAYQEELNLLDHKIAQMGGLTEHNLGRAFDALNNSDPQLAERVMAALKITGDLERIGDLAKNIAKRSRAIASEHPPKPLMLGLRNMVERALSQLKDVLDAYADRNADLALAVWKRDEQIDAMYNSVFRELLTYMMEDPRNIGMCTHLLFGAKNLERIGDHTTNIAETIHFFVLGHDIEADRPKSDKTSTTLIDPTS